MPYIVLANRLAFQPVMPNDPRIPDGPEEVVEKGGVVPDYVTTFLISSLASSGLVVWADDTRPDLHPVDEVPAQVRTPDQPPVLPSDPQGTPPLLSDLVAADDSAADPVVVDVPPANEPDPAPAPLAPLPKANESKDTWERYAADNPQIGMTLEQAEAMNKTDLMAEVKRRHEAASA